MGEGRFAPWPEVESNYRRHIITTAPSRCEPDRNGPSRFCSFLFCFSWMFSYCASFFLYFLFPFFLISLVFFLDVGTATYCCHFFFGSHNRGKNRPIRGGHVADAWLACFCLSRTVVCASLFFTCFPPRWLISGTTAEVQDTYSSRKLER